MDFTSYFQKWPQKFSEHVVVKDIHHTLELADYELEDDKIGRSHEKYMVEAYKKLEDYFRAKEIDPDTYQL